MSLVTTDSPVKICDDGQRFIQKVNLSKKRSSDSSVQPTQNLKRLPSSSPINKTWRRPCQTASTPPHLFSTANLRSRSTLRPFFTPLQIFTATYFKNK